MATDSGWVLICDQEPHIRDSLRGTLEARGCAVDTFDGGPALLKVLGEERESCPDLVLLDADGPGTDGLEVLRRVKVSRPEQAVVMMSSFATVKGAVGAMKLGALDFLVKPFAAEEVTGLVEQLVERNRLVKENRSLKAEIRRRFDPGQVVFESKAFGRVFEMTRRVAASEVNVLIQGESGTGKELIASTIHYGSRRSDQRFLTVNCAALTDTLLESQLFGYVKGAFTGAASNRRGLVEEADGGTLFLDEIGDVSPSLQAKLLRVLQEKEFLPVGSTRSRRADVRFVAATNKDLDKEVARGAFREDLYYRLNVANLRVPPLRERPEDVVPLARFFLDRYGTRGQVLAAATVEQLQAYPWPGNVRELENVVEMAAVLSSGGEITPEYLPAKVSEPSPRPFSAMPTDLSLEALEARHIEQVLHQTGYHKVNTAKILQIGRTTLDRKIAQYGLRREDP